MSGTRRDSPWYATPNTKRHRPMVRLTLDPGYYERLGELARRLGISKSRAVEWLLDRLKEG